MKLEKLKSIVNDILQNKGDEKVDDLTPDLSLRDNIGFDSLDLAEFTALVEDEFGVDVFESGVINTIQEVLNKIDNGKVE